MQTSLAALLLALCAASAHAQPTCSFITFTQEWRDATASDYDSDNGSPVMVFLPTPLTVKIVRK